MKIKKNAEIRAAARERLLGQYSRVILVQLFYIFLVFGIMIASGSGTGTDIGAIVLYYAITFISYIILQVFMFGLSKTYLNACCRMPYGVGSLFSGFGDNRVVVSAIMFATLQFIFSIPGLIMAEKYLSSGNGIYEEYALLASSAGTIVYYIVWLSFSQLYYVLLDFPEKSLGDCIKMSIWLMKGQKLKFVGMQISFFPLLLLTIPTLGLGLLWVMPYMQASEASFYLSLTSGKAAGTN
ncbi:MAG: DUF975 family protein [Lachnospiraceae bacterium]|nr:DUF975 family protein [Lachnospiraceae bacterium]